MISHVEAAYSTAGLGSYTFVVLFGGIIGASELISRYKDDPWVAVWTIPALIYVSLNAGASFAALYLIQQMKWLTELSPDPGKRLLLQTLVAAFGAMAFFRSSLFTARVGSTEIQVGPAAFLQIILSAADRACDRRRAKPRAKAIAEIMNNISFTKAQLALPSLCFGLMQNVSSDEQRNFGLIVKELQTAQMDDAIKSNNLGLALMNIVGEGVLREAVTVLRRLISEPPKQVVQSIFTLRLLKALEFDQMADQLVDECLLVSGQSQAVGYRNSLMSQVSVIRRMKLPEVQKGLLLSALLINEFSEDILQAVLKSLAANSNLTQPTPPTSVPSPPTTAPEQHAPNAAA